MPSFALRNWKSSRAQKMQYLDRWLVDAFPVALKTGQKHCVTPRVSYALVNSSNISGSCKTLCEGPAIWKVSVYVGCEEDEVSVTFERCLEKSVAYLPRSLMS